MTKRVRVWLLVSAVALSLGLAVAVTIDILQALWMAGAQDRARAQFAREVCRPATGADMPQPTPTDHARAGITSDARCRIMRCAVGQGREYALVDCGR